MIPDTTNSEVIFEVTRDGHETHWIHPVAAWAEDGHPLIVVDQGLIRADRFASTLRRNNATVKAWTVRRATTARPTHPKNGQS